MNKSLHRFLLKTRQNTNYRGFTLVELMVALVISLTMMGAVVSLFGLLGESLSDSRSDAALVQKLRNTERKLKDDLMNSTVTPDPGMAEQPPGHFEYVEGADRDDREDPSSVDTSIGDLDDVLSFTIYSEDRPYTGKLDATIGATIGGTSTDGSEAPAATDGGSDGASNPSGALYNTFRPGFGGETRTAEVIWFVTENPARAGIYRLHRYQLMVAPEADLSSVTIDTTSAATIKADVGDFFEFNDISARREGTSMVANSLEDLARRYNRRGHKDTSSTLTPFTPAIWSNSGDPALWSDNTKSKIFDMIEPIWD
ncbi:MAG: prepilin-type N-terminal cleavage/methylation domain-containing protein, partial [Planctomycetales bacterium]